MWLLWISVLLFVIWIVWGLVNGVTAAFWILLTFAVIFLVVHLYVRLGSRTT